MIPFPWFTHRVDDPDRDLPEHRGRRRAFIAWALMLGAIPPERMVERIVAELEQEGER
jgi:hypothetical protein